MAQKASLDSSRDAARTPPRATETAAAPWYSPKRLFWFCVAQWFLIGNGVAIVLAWRWPQVARDGGYIRPEYSIQYGAIAAIFLITGLTLSTPALWNQARNYRLHLHTLAVSFLIYPTVTFALVNIIKAAGNPQIDMLILVGMVYIGCANTSIASNISMTIAGGGNGEAATVEVVLGNFLGVFLSPLLNLMYFSAPGWSVGTPTAANGQSGLAGLPEMYRRVFMKLGLAMWVPFSVGQVIQNFFPKQTKWAARTFHLPKISSFLLILLVWTVFSTQFYNDAFHSISASSTVLPVFLNIILYVGFNGFCILSTRLPFLPSRYTRSTDPLDPSSKRLPIMLRFAAEMRMPKGETTAICYCGAAKGLAVAIPMLDILYGGFSARDRAVVSIPFGLFQVEQVILAQIMTHVFRPWNAKPDRLFPPPVQEPAMELEPSVASIHTELSADKARDSPRQGTAA